MYNVILLVKDIYSDRFFSIDNVFSGSLSIPEISQLFPYNYLLVTNTDIKSDSNLIIGRKRLLELFKIDKEGQFKCVNCGKKNKITREACMNCYHENKYFNVVKYLDKRFADQSFYNQYVVNEFAKKYE